MTSEDLQRLASLEDKLIDLQLKTLTKQIDDHEKRIRPLEDTATKFNFLLYLTLGGGLLSLLNLIVLLTTLAVLKASP